MSEDDGSATVETADGNVCRKCGMTVLESVTEAVDAMQDFRGNRYVTTLTTNYPCGHARYGEN